VISSSFFFALFFTNVLFGSFSRYVSALAPKFCSKNARVNVDEIETYILSLPSELVVLGLLRPHDGVRVVGGGDGGNIQAEINCIRHFNDDQ